MRILSAIFFLMTLLSSLARDPALVLHLSFDSDFASSGVVTDLSGQGNHGYRMVSTNWITATTGGAYGSQMALFVTNGFATNGGSIYETSQYIAITNLSARLQKITNGTVSFWVQFFHKAGVSPSFQANCYLIDGGYHSPPAGKTNNYRIGRQRLPDQTRISMRVYAAATTDSDGDLVIQGPQRSIGGGSSGGTNNGTATFDHYAISWNCTSNISKIYLNGALVGTNTCNGLPYFQIAGEPNDWLCIGANKHNSGSYLLTDAFPNDAFHNGTFDDDRMYDRTLEESEVAGLSDGTFDPAEAPAALELRGQVRVTGAARSQ